MSTLFEPKVLWEVGAHLGEGPMWHAPSKSVYFVDIKERKIHRCAFDGSERRTWDAPNQATFVVPCKDQNGGGGLVTSLRDGVHRFDEAAGSFSQLHAVEAELADNRFNDGYVDHQGRLWFGSMHDPESDPTGALYSVGADGQVQVQDTGYRITNGPAMSPDGKTLYHTDTLGKTVYQFDVEDGKLSNKRVFVHTLDAGWPDGMAVDADGFIWIAMFRGHRIDRYSPAGEVVQTVKFPVPNITKLAFGGEDLRTAYVTTAWKGLSDQERAQFPLAGALFTFQTDTPGLAQHEFLIEATK
ncbi:MAG: SMP-30/gluconolactonase/LRE family protein [Gammaproteobacteria bacterium]